MGNLRSMLFFIYQALPTASGPSQLRFPALKVLRLLSQVNMKHAGFTSAVALQQPEHFEPAKGYVDGFGAYCSRSHE